MTPPTPTEVTEYAKSIGFVLSGETFCDYYEARGWKYGQGKPMVNWQAAVRTWKNKQGGMGIGKTKSAVGTTGGFIPSKQSAI